MANNNRIKIAGYAKRIFFNDNIEYRNFSPDLVGFQLTSEGGTTLFTNGNFSISVNLDPKPNVLFTQGTKSKFFTLDDISTSGDTQSTIQSNVKTKLNIDITNPLSYIWYGSSSEMIRASLLDIQENWPAAIYVDNKVGSVTGNNITDYVYDISSDESTFKVNSNFFNNPYAIKYTEDSKYVATNSEENPLRNFTLKYGSYVIEHNGIVKNIKSITPSTQKTNSELTLVVDGNPFPELTGIYIPQYSFLSNNVDASIPYFIKPNESEIEKFFSGLDDFQRTILNRNITPIYRAEIISSNYTDDGVLLTSKKVYDFPLMDDGYNLNFFDTFYIAYLTKLTKLGEGLDQTNTDIIFRKYTTEAINSFDTLPKADGEDLTLNGEKATKLVRIYGVEFDYVKKYINGIKFAHVVTYNKRNNLPDVLVKDLAFMLGLEPINFISDTSFSKLYLPSNGGGQFSGTSTNLTKEQIDVELYRRLILNIAWLWKSKGSRKAVEFLFRFIGAPESLVNFNEYIVVVDKPLDIEEIKRLLYIYTGEVDLSNIPYDDDGFPLPPVNGDLVISNFIDPETGEVVENGITDMYFQKAGGWYRETYGSNVLTVLNGNNPHVGPYDGGSEYLQYFSRCYIPNFDNEPTVVITADTIRQNYFVNYNYGIFNGIPTGTTFYTTQLTYNSNTNNYQPIDNCLNVNYSIIETPLQNDGKTTLQQAFAEAEAEYNAFLELIQKDSYLVYSPEWQIIKNNYELSLKNCLNEISTEDCDTNKTLEICLNGVEVETTQYSCDNLSLKECSPFLYYEDENGNKVSFDKFPQCCGNNNGNFVSYVNEYGRLTEYCTTKAPCVGKPLEPLENGIVPFLMTENTVPDNIFQLYDRCYQYIYEQTIPLSEFEDVIGYTPQEIITSFLSGDYQIAIPFETLFSYVSCDITSVVSSPECCAYYGLNYTIVNGGQKEYIVCLKNNLNNLSDEQVPQFTLQDRLSLGNYTMPNIDEQINTTYYDLQNPIGSVYNYYSTNIFEDCFNESILVKEVVNTSNNIIATPNSILDDPSLMNPSNWEVHTIDEYGRVSFEPIIYDNNFIIDWDSTEEVSDLYQLIAEFYGYQFGYFTIDQNSGKLITYKGENPYSNNPNTIFSAAVDPNRVGCDDFNNVSVVFGSENWQGFKLPELEDCSCTIDFSFDYMLKYDAGNLIECANNISCNPAIIHDNTISNINCLNFVAFTNSIDESQTLQGNFNDREDVTEEYIIWQNTNVLEPNVECCNALGGNVVSVTQWASLNQNWVSQINTTYGELFINPSQDLLATLNFNTGEILQFIEKYKNIKSNVENEISGCFNLTLLFPTCDIQYNNYITTQSICNLEVPLECGIWSKLLTDYKTLESAIMNVIGQYNSLCAEPLNDTISQIDVIKTFNGLTTQETTELEKLKSSEDKLNEQILLIENDISKKSGDNIIIEKAITNVDNPLDCSVYQNKINEIRNFDYNSYCNSLIYGDINSNDGTKQNEFNVCISTKTLENQNEELLYSQLLEDCFTKNRLNEELNKAKFDNNQTLISEIESQLLDVNNDINRLTTDYNNTISYDESKQSSIIENNDTQNTIIKTAELLNTNTENITDNSGNLVLSDTQKIELDIIYNKNISQISDLSVELGETNILLNQNLIEQNTIISGTKIEQNNVGNTVLEPLSGGTLGTGDGICDFIDPSLLTSSLSGALLYNGLNIPLECCNSNAIPLDGTFTFIGRECFYSSKQEEIKNCCDVIDTLVIEQSLEELQQEIPTIEQKTQECYDNWYNKLVGDYEVYEEENNSNFDSYLNKLKVNFKLFVNNTNDDTQTNIDTGLTYLPYTQGVNPIWEWDPTNGYTGVILEGTEQEIAVIEDGIFNHLSQLNVPYNSEMFEPEWQTFNFTIPECVCDDLRRLYPNKEFFLSIGIENYECSLCLLVDNIQVNVADCQTNRILSINDCMIPQLSCVIDNKKSWVYYDDGVVKQTIYPNGDCNTGSTSNYEIVKLGAQQERLWLDLEYRYTDYDVNHSDLILNVKNSTFSIDPAKAIECDVFNYWKNIDCNNCINSCTSANTVIFSGQVYSSTTLENYTLDLSASTSGLTFSCSTFTDLLENQVLELKNNYYTLTSNYTTSLNASYYELLNLGSSLSKFSIQKNNCGTDTLILNNNREIDNLFGLITENYDGTISFYESYIYTGSTPYTGGTLVEVLSGITAQTFNQTPFVNSGCCKTINNLLNSEGVGGLDLGKNYQWDSNISACVWKPINGCSNCNGDCEYCGTLNECSNGFYTGTSYNVCINPLDYLDIQPSEINIKAVFDQLVQTNLIDVKSRQTISDYPLLRLFYELYLNASNCGKDLSGKYTYDTMFEFMDKIGDYWLDLLEQVVPATTIWEGCDNSGKIYRNTIFDNNKFNYKRYSLNFIDVEVDCPLSAQTDFSIGSETKHSLVEQKPIYPSSPEITQLKTNILNKELEITLLKKQISVEQSKLCAIRLQDLDTPNLQDLIDSQQSQIDLLNSELDKLNQQLVELNNQLGTLENEYLQQQQNYYMNFMSCSGITQNLINAQNNLSGFTQGTTAYETQRNFIAGLRDKYTKCVRKANTLVSDYNTVFITQIYDSNEYEGNVEIFGDPDFDIPNFTKTLPPEQLSGWYYNQELIHNC